MDFQHNGSTIPLLIVKYLLNELSDAERAQLEAWATDSPENWQAFIGTTNLEQLSKDLDELGGYDKEEALKRIKSKLGNK